MSPDEIGVKRVIMIADDLDVDYAVINSRRKNRKGMPAVWKRHARLNHQHLSDNWQIVEVEEDDLQNEGEHVTSEQGEENDDNDDGILLNIDKIVQHLPSELGTLHYIKCNFYKFLFLR
jgi:phosphoribosylpyrophosphate synthetase